MIVRRHRSKNFTILENDVVEDERLALDEIGLLTWLRSRPDHWEVSRAHIAKRFKVGRDKVARIFRSLIECGWMVREITPPGVPARYVVNDEAGAEVELSSEQLAEIDSGQKEKNDTPNESVADVSQTENQSATNLSQSGFPSTENPSTYIRTDSEQVLSPNPPSGGARSEKPDEEESKIQIWFDRFASAYPIPISDVPRTKAWARKATGAKREDAITGATGYADFLAGEAKRGRSRAVKDAHRWLNAEGFSGYLPRHKAAAAQGESDKPSPELHSLDTPAGRALKTLSRIAHYAPWEHGGQIYGVVTPKVLAFATAPPGSQWTVHKRGAQQFWAWWEFLSKEVFAGCALRELTEIIAPWEWPPRKDGTIYTPDSTGPPGKSMAEQDAEWIEKYGLR